MIKIALFVFLSVMSAGVASHQKSNQNESGVRVNTVQPIQQTAPTSYLQPASGVVNE